MSTQRDYRNRPKPLPAWASVLVECVLIASVVGAIAWQW
jgi:hypothetical protein